MKERLKASIVKINEHCFQFTVGFKDGEILHTGIATSKNDAVKMVKVVAVQIRAEEKV